MSQGIRIDSKFSENVANSHLGFVTRPDYTIVSGTGNLVVKEVQRGGNTDNPLVFKGHYALEILDLDYNNEDLVFNGVGDDYVFRTEVAGFYFTSFYLCRKLAQTDINTVLKLEVFQDGSPLGFTEFPINTTTMPNPTDWYRFGQYTFYDSSRDYTYKWTIEKQADAASNLFYIIFDGFCIQKININNPDGVIPDYTLPRSIILETTQDIDVPSISSNNVYVLEVELEGAKVGDYVQMTYPSELIDLGIIVGIPIVTEDGLIKTLLHNHSGGPVNPASGPYTFKIVK